MAKAKRVHSTPRRTTSSRKAPARKRARVAAPFPALDDWPEDAYYEFTIADRSMEPRHYEGCIAYVDPRWPLKEGHDVLFKIATPGGGAPKAYVKELVSIDDKTLRGSTVQPQENYLFSPEGRRPGPRVMGRGDKGWNAGSIGATFPPVTADSGVHHVDRKDEPRWQFQNVSATRSRPKPWKF